jgi:hypothetical protein
MRTYHATRKVGDVRDDPVPGEIFPRHGEGWVGPIILYHVAFPAKRAAARSIVFPVKSSAPVKMISMSPTVR